MKIKKILLAFVLFLAMGSLVSMQAQAATHTFSDVPKTAEYYNAVHKLVEMGAISTATDKFNPGKNVTRGQAAKILAIALDLDTENVKNPQFKDVPTTHDFYPYIAALADAKIINGYSNGNFGVNAPLTRAQMAKIIVKGFDIPLTISNEKAFSDINYQTETGKYVDTLYYYEIANNANKKFNPNSPIKRSHLALFIERTLDTLPIIEEEVRIDSSVFKLTNYAEVDYQMYDETVAHHVERNGKNLILHPLEEGKTTFNIFDAKGNFVSYLLVTVTEKSGALETTYIIKDKIARKDKISTPVEFHSLEDGTDIEKFSLFNLTKNELINEEVLTDEYDYLYTMSNNEDIELLTITNAKGKSERYFINSTEHDHYNETNYFQIKDDNAFMIEIDGEASDAKVVSPLKTTVSDAGVKVQYSKAGVYPLTISFDGEVYWEFEVTVFEHNGTLGYYYTVL